MLVNFPAIHLHLIEDGDFFRRWVKLFSLINHRYTKEFKTIITTNHDLKGFLSGEVSFHQRIAARLCDENLSMLVLSSAS